MLLCDSVTNEWQKLHFVLRRSVNEGIFGGQISH